MRTALAALLLASVVTAFPLSPESPEPSDEDSSDPVDTSWTPRGLRRGWLRGRYSALRGWARIHAQHVLENLGEDFLTRASDDEAYRFDDNGDLLVADAPLPDGAADVTQGDGRARRAAELPTPESYDINGLPIHHSRPGAANTLYLALQGGTISGTAWGGGQTYVVYPYRKDSISDLTRGAAEQAQISELFQRIAEDFAPFDIDVTTEQPAGWPTNQGGNVGTLIFTQGNDANGVANPHSGYGGIAYVNVWGRADFDYRYSPAWCKDYLPRSAAEVGSHEAGHNLGLSHDGCSTCGGYQSKILSSQGIQFAPIMGSSYGADVTQWSKGDYHEATQFQDDLSIIEGKLGYVADDHAGITLLNIAFDGVTTTIIDGVIERSNDIDEFSFYATEAFSITVNAASTHPADTRTSTNLRFELTISDGSATYCSVTAGAQYANLVPAWSASTCSFTGLPQMYTISVTGVASDDTNPANGETLFLEYASLGSYKIDLTASIVGSPPSYSPQTTQPTALPTSPPTSTSTLVPSPLPTLSPASLPTLQPTLHMTPPPTAVPTPPPTMLPTQQPTSPPTLQPNVPPSYVPTRYPTDTPTPYQSAPPSASPAQSTRPPTLNPTPEPTMLPTQQPTSPPTLQPTVPPSFSPSMLPTVATAQPTSLPTWYPTDTPTPYQSAPPSASPAQSTRPPTLNPTPNPTMLPTAWPTALPTAPPTQVLTQQPTFSPTIPLTPTPSNTCYPRRAFVGVGNCHLCCRGRCKARTGNQFCK